MKKFHIAIGVSAIADSVADYSARLGQDPDLIIADEYALWRTANLNFSIRKSKDGAGNVRHLGWEDSEAKSFSSEPDCNGILWEHFTASDQAEEIQSTWPAAKK